MLDKIREFLVRTVPSRYCPCQRRVLDAASGSLAARLANQCRQSSPLDNQESSAKVAARQP
eukprot:scaffold12210_cov136-Amphora_coffeaeformis.AAC.2